MVPVDSEQHVRCLREYRKVLQSTMGPLGSCKAIVTSGGYTDMACTCKTLTSRLELSSPICKYINNIAAGQIDHGLYCAVLLCHLLEHQLLSEDSTKRKTEQEAMEVIFQQIKKLLISEYVCKSLCFDSVKNLIPLVRTVIVSKCLTFLSGMEVDGLCMEVIRVFINCVDEETNVVNKIHLKVESGLNAFMSCKGLLYTVTESHHIEIASKVMSNIKVLVFVVKLEYNADSFTTCTSLLDVLDLSVQLGVKVIACQQVISPEVKVFLKRKNIIFLERMGSDFTKQLIRLTHSFPLSQLNIVGSEIENFFGHLTSVELLRFFEQDYLVLHNKNICVATLLIQTSSLLGQENIKVCFVLHFVD